MDLTLTDLLSHANDIHMFFNNKSAVAPVKLLNDKILYLQKSIKTIQTISKRMADISNICNRVLQYRIKDTTFKPTYINPYPDDNWALLENSTNLKKSVVKGVNVGVKIVNDVSEIPNIPLYWIDNLKEFGVRINGILLTGNLGNICTNGIDNKFIRRCEFESKCKKLTTKKKCKYYHTNKEVIDAKLTPELQEWYLSNRRQFTNGSWLYNPNGPHGRKISSANMLITDLIIWKNNKANETIYAQTMHDIILVCVLNEFINLTS